MKPKKNREMSIYLDPKNDLAFKRVFGEHKHLCMSLINSMLPLEKPVVSIEYLPCELAPRLPDVLRNSIVDVRCKDADNREFIVEMQMYWSESVYSRMLFNAAKSYVLQLDRGNDYNLLHPVYAISFVNDRFDKSPEMEDEYYHYYKIVNVKNTNKQIKGLEFLLIELPKFKPQNRAEKKLHELWLRFLTEINERTIDVPNELLENELTREAVEYMKIGAYTREQLYAYDYVKINLWTLRADLHYALERGRKKGLNEGLEKGLEKGMKKGLEEGKLEGKLEGKMEGKMEVALKMLNKGMPVKDICDFTGLSEQEIIKLTCQ